MATNTTNYSIVKPAPTETYNVAIVNSNSDIIDATMFSKADKTQEAWITPTLLNSWTNVAGEAPLQYYKDNFGVVHFRGCIKGGTSGSIAFKLPVGYRLSYWGYFPLLYSGSTLGYMKTTSTADVYVTAANTSVLVSFDNVSFKAEQ